jgi:DNA-directed RNA polymerase specialized sigma24 family protein
MNHAALTTAALTHLDTLYNLAVWLEREPAAAALLAHETYRRALDTIPRNFPGTKLRVRLFTLLWEIYRQHHPLHADVPAASFKREEMERGKASVSHRKWLYVLPRSDVEAELRQLPPTLRAALILVDMEGYPRGEVAEIFGWPKDQVQGALSQARRTLHHLLQVRLAATLVSPPPAVEDPS